jgi:hypothetical protein
MEDGKEEGRRKRRETTGERKERRLLKKKADELFVRKKREGSKKRTKISLSYPKKIDIQKKKTWPKRRCFSSRRKRRRASELCVLDEKYSCFTVSYLFRRV